MKNFLFWNILVLVALNGHAQIEGVVVDGKGKGIPNVMVIAVDSITNTSDTIRSDKRGFYFFTKLKPGKYKLTATATGFDVVISKYILLKAAPANADEGDDTYYAIRHDIVLHPNKE